MPAAVLQHAQADVGLNVRVIEVVQEIQDQDRVGLRPDFLQQVEDLVAGEGSGQADASEDLLYLGGPAADGLDQRVGGDPFTAGDGIEGAAHGQRRKQLGDAFALPAGGLDQPQAGGTTHQLQGIECKVG